MIWNSIWLMTIFDLLILGLVVYAFVSFYQQRAVLSDWRIYPGFLAIGFGLSLLALLYLVDLLTMHAFPLVMSAPQVVATMERLHLDASWIVALIGVGAISLGFKYANHSVFSLIDSLHASQTRLLRELSVRRESEAALREIENRLANAASIAKLGFWVWDEIEDKAVYCSDELAVIYGVATGRELTALLSSSDKNLEWVHPADRERVGVLMRESKAKKRAIDTEYRIVRPDGQVRHLHEVLKPVLDNQGNLIRSNGIIHDNTERKRAEEALRLSEERYALAVRGSNDGIWGWNIEDDEIDYSPRLLEIVGYSQDREKLSADEVLEGIHPQDRLAYKEALIAHLNGETEYFTSEFRVIGEDGSICWVLDRGMALRDVGGRAYRMAGSVTDITERKRAEEQLRQSEKLKAVGQLTGGLAHDFNNLLAVITLNAGLVKEALEDGSSAAESLESMTRVAKRGAELTHRLLAFSRQQNLQSEVTDVNALVIGMIDMLRRTLRETIEIETALAEDLWCTRIDPHQMENALLNLAINARDAMAKGGMLTIETANVQLDDAGAAARGDLAPGAYVRLSVTDSGSGMAPEVIEHAFEPLFTTKNVGEGTGLGLSMIYGFAKQSGGHVTITSEAGHGTTVYLYLPRSEAAAQTAEAPATVAEPPGRGETVLVVEDDADVRRVVANVLSHLGYQVLEAGDGEQALAALAHAPGVDLLLSDVVLPGGRSGPEIETEAKRQRPGLKSLLMSGYALEAVSYQGRLPDGTTLLQKPFATHDLAQKVRAALDGRAARSG